MTGALTSEEAAAGKVFIKWWLDIMWLSYGFSALLKQHKTFVLNSAFYEIDLNGGKVRFFQLWAAASRPNHCITGFLLLLTKGFTWLYFIMFALKVVTRQECGRGKWDFFAYSYAIQFTSVYIYC